jgi:uncharacterized membrane protein HdeD (DUF308 family)
MPQDWLNIGWKILMLRGVLAVIFGIIAMVAPITTAVAFVLLWGIWALADGIGSIAQGFQNDGERSRWLLFAMGAISLLAAGIAITNPVGTGVTLTWILGIWLMVRGAFELAGAFSATSAAPRGLLFLGAALDIVLGLLFFMNPGRSAVTIAVVLGITAVAWGFALLGVGFWMRREAKTLSEAAAVS